MYRAQLDRGPSYPSLLGLWFYTEIHDLVMPNVYKYKPTYRLSFADLSTRETKDLTGMALCDTIEWTI